MIVDILNFPMIRFTDVVIGQILSDIGSHVPERGGALLGLPRTSVVCKFISDPDARVTGSSYVPSDQLQAAVNEEEGRSGLSFCGIVHSHPHNLNVPSFQDHNAFYAGLERNPHLASFVAPIITFSSRVPEEHELTLTGDVTMSNYVAYRPKRRTLFSTVSVIPEAIDIVPIARATDELSSRLSEELDETPTQSDGLIEVNGIHHFTTTFRLQIVELIVVLPPIYPLSPPTVFLTDLRNHDSTPAAVSLSWRGPQNATMWMDETCNAVFQLYGANKCRTKSI